MILSPQAAPQQPASSSTQSLAAHKAALLAVPVGLKMRQPKRAGGKGKSRKSRPVKDGQVVAKFFNPVAGRPQPTLTSLEQGITVSLSLAVAGFATSVTVPTFSSWVFALSQCASVSQYTSLFDQYRFDQIEVWLEPLNDTTASASAPFASAIDLDDANVPTAFNECADRQGALIGTSIAGRYHKWKPHMATAVYSGAFTSFANDVADWIDVASSGVQHYGLKAAAGIDGIARTMNITVRALVSFRGPAI